MNILVLGGNGFIGSHIVELLTATNHTVRIFVRNSECFHFQHNVDFFLGDFLDKGKLAEALVGVEAVVHCISTTVPSTSFFSPIFDIESNLIGSVELLRLMGEQGISRLLYFSSGGTVYGNPLLNPVDENAPLKPISNYGVVKVAIENFIEVSKMNFGIKPVIIRPSNPYGERQGHKGVQGIISTLLTNAMNELPTMIYGDGTAVRDYLYVKDLARLVYKVLSSNRCGVYNAGSGIGFSINQLIDTIEKVTDVTISKQYREARDFDVNEIVLDSKLAEEHFGWNASIPLETGIKKQYEWLIKQHK
ncbi:MAG: NAD-dependent epimerase/dehydratase family protein [Candidatus Electrothrix communis]|nr:MAG: NAD-dependent epimerase/dehydratase family protein [Candidatus Electrothrix communis]